jgi:hypothetical protein
MPIYSKGTKGAPYQSLLPIANFSRYYGFRVVMGRNEGDGPSARQPRTGAVLAPARELEFATSR